MDIEVFLPTSTPATLALADGSVFSGFSIGANGQTLGEVVFNTAMTGYQEILTDPSYAQQIVTLTYPHIGNTGINLEDNESRQSWVAGLVIRELSPVVSNWRAKMSLPDYLKKNNIVAIAGIDTRRLTRILRNKGAQSGCIITGKVDAQVVIDQAKSFAGLEGKDLAQVVSREEVETNYNAAMQSIEDVGMQNFAPDCQNYHVVVYDFGIKENILRLLQASGCKLTIVPAKTPVESVLALKPDGVMLSNGPGDPAACEYAIDAVKVLLEKRVPTFGICLGFQIMALACGAKTFKMKFGHHGANHPVQDLKTKQVFITSQNHGFAVDRESLPPCLEETHISLFDQTLQGFKHKTVPAMAFQGHPEAGPGPHDVSGLFDKFINTINVGAQNFASV